MRLGAWKNRQVAPRHPFRDSNLPAALVPVKLLVSGIARSIGPNHRVGGTGTDDECFNAALGKGYEARISGGILSASIWGLT